MFTNSPQTIFTPISSSAEYIGSQIYFDRVLPTFDVPIGHTTINTDYRACNDASISDCGPSSFSLLHSHIGDAGLLLHPFISKLLNDDNPTAGGAAVTKLDLSYCALTSNAFGTIIAAVSRLTLLQQIFLTGNNFSSPLKIMNFTTGQSYSATQVVDPANDQTKGEPTSLEDFLDILCDVWESHSSLSLVVIDPWITSTHGRFQSIRQKRSALQRWQSSANTLGHSGYTGEGATTSKKNTRKEHESENATLRRTKKKDLLDDDEEEEFEKAAFENVNKTFTNTSLVDLLPLRQRSKTEFLKEVVTQLLVQEAQAREAIKTDELSVIRSISLRMLAAADAIAKGIVRIKAKTSDHAPSTEHADRQRQFRKLEAKIRREEERIEEKHRERLVREKAAAFTEVLKRLQRQ